VRTYQDCPKKYNYAYTQGLASAGEPKAFFHKGNYFHELSHVYYQLIEAGATPGSDAALLNIMSRIRNDLDKAPSIELVPIYATVTKIMTRFIKEQSPLIDKDITVLGIEQELDYEVTTPKGRNISLFGFIDLIYRDSNGHLRIRDHKTGQKAWTRSDATASNQLLHYALATYLRTREAPMAEISYINSKDYVRKPAEFDKAFAFVVVNYSKKELELYLQQILILIDDMLDSRPVPHYGSQCNWCPFLTPCTLERKGIDPSPIIREQYTVVDRNAIRQHAKFTDDDSNGDDAD